MKEETFSYSYKFHDCLYGIHKTRNENQNTKHKAKKSGDGTVRLVPTEQKYIIDPENRVYDKKIKEMPPIHPKDFIWFLNHQNNCSKLLKRIYKRRDCQVMKKHQPVPSAKTPERYTEKMLPGKNNTYSLKTETYEKLDFKNSHSDLSIDSSIKGTESQEQLSLKVKSNMFILLQMDEINRVLKKHGYSVVNVPMDGDCFYNALILKLSPNYTADSLRRKVAEEAGQYVNSCQHVAYTNPKYDKDICERLLTKDNLTLMAKRGQSSDVTDIIFAARVLKRPIMVIKKDGKNFLSVNKKGEIIQEIKSLKDANKLGEDTIILVSDKVTVGSSAINHFMPANQTKTKR